jgi:uncharacterized membrane protein YdbT with pleckstrin-like domain
MEESILYHAHPSMFRNRPFSFVLCLILSLVGIGLIIFLVWWIKTKGTELTVTNERVSLRKGILSKFTNDVYLTDIRNVQLYQSFWQRVFRVGSVAISSAGNEGIEIEVKGIPNPDRIKEIIDTHRRDRFPRGQKGTTE